MFSMGDEYIPGYLDKKALVDSLVRKPSIIYTIYFDAGVLLLQYDSTKYPYVSYSICTPAHE